MASSRGIERREYSIIGVLVPSPDDKRQKKRSLPPQIDEFRLIKLLGRGGMGEVHLAHDVVLDRPVAIKVMLDPDPQERSRLIFEARAAARLQHPNIVAIHRVGEFDGLPYIASEYVRGESLSDLSMPLSGERVVELAVPIARGLAAAHRRGVVHRDIKPGNILITEDGVPKIADFGLAKLLDLGPDPRFDSDSSGEPATYRSAPAYRMRHHTQEEEIIGTPLYMAPELWLDESATACSDVYSFGVLLYELCTNKVPHEDVPPRDFPFAVTSQAPIPLRDHNPEIDPSLVAVIDRCLDRDRDTRFSAGDQVLDALLALQQRSRSVEIPAGGPYRGLLPFEADHRELFFGRDRDIHDVIDRLRTQPIAMITGESGVGKSSLVRAGVAPRIRDHGLGDGRVWRSAVVIPGSHPLVALASELARQLELDEAGFADELAEDIAAASQRVRAAQGNGEGLLLVVDQLEELVTLSDPEQASRAGRAMFELTQRTPGIRLVATIRSDKLTGLVELTGLGREFERALYLLGPLDEERIRETIIRPAAAAGVEFESDRTVTELVQATKNARAGLPLLQFTLAEIWQARDRENATIPAQVLEEVGGVEGALSRHADSVLDAMLPEVREAARKVMVQLVTLHGTRSRHDEITLTGKDGKRAAALRALVKGRLLVVRESDGRSTYEIAHEALITHWSTLGGWLSEEDSARAVREQLAFVVEAWERMDRSRDSLWRGHALRQAMALPGEELTPLESDFVLASQRDEERGRRRRRALVTAAFVALLIGLVVVLLFARRTAIERDRADSERARASAFGERAQQLAEQVERRLMDSYREQGRKTLLDGDPMRAMVYLEEARKLGADDMATRFMIARALHGLEGQQHVLPADQSFVTWAEFSPDGTRVATCGEDKLARIWDAVTGESLVTLKGHEAKVWMLDFHPDGQQVATASWDKTFRVWDATTGKQLWSKSHEQAVQWLGYTPDGARLLTVTRDHLVQVWNARTGELVRTLLEGQPEYVTIAALGPGGRHLATGSFEGKVRVWNMETGELVRVIEGGGRILHVALSPDDSRVAFMTGKGETKLVPLGRGPTRVLPGHETDRGRVAFSPDSTQLLTIRRDQVGTVWDVATGARLWDLQGHTGHIWFGAFSPDGQSIVTASLDGTLRTWDARRRVPIWTFWGHEDAIWLAHFDARGDRIVSAGFDGTARIWNARQTPYDRAVGEHTRALVSAVPGPDGHRIATGQEDGTVQIWSRDGKQLLSLQAGDAKGRVTWSPDGDRVLVSRGRDMLGQITGRDVSIWDGSAGTALLRLTDAGGEILWHAVYGPGGTRIAVASGDHTASIRDAETGDVQVILKGHESAVRFVAFDPTGTHVVTAGVDKTARLWRADSGRLLRTLKGHTLQVNTARFSVDGQLLITAGEDRTARIWNRDGEQVALLEGHSGSVVDALFSADGHLAATAAEDGTVGIWHVDSGKLLWSIDHHAKAVRSVERMASGAQLLTASDTRAAVWSIDQDERTVGELREFVRCRVFYKLDRANIERSAIPYKECRDSK